MKYRFTHKLVMALSGFIVGIGILMAATGTGHAASSVNSHVELYGGTTLTSDSGQFSLAVQGDGNVVAYFGNRPYWALGTSSQGARLAVQGDGNLVLYTSSYSVLWASGTYDPAGAQLRIQNDGNVVLVGNSRGLLWASNKAPTRLYSGQKLVGDNWWTIYSPNYRYRMVMQPDGNVVAYDGGTAIWSKHGAQQHSTLEMQTDANLVLYNGSHTALWATNKFGPNGSYLEGQNDGNFVVYSPNGVALWSTRGDTTPDVGGVSNGLITGSDRDLAQKILGSGKVTGDSRYIGQIQAYANGNYGCHINPTILSVIYTIVAPASNGGLNHSIYISSLNRYCTGVITSSGTSSYHYTSGGGHAVDIAIVDGVSSTGYTDNDLALLRQIIPRLPSGSGLGQSDCRQKRYNQTRDSKYILSLPAGITQFSDTCNHNHIQVPIR